MSKEIHITKYKCEVCGALYGSKANANECESRPVSQDKGVKVEELVVITGGEGIGKKAKVTEVYIIDKYWSHYAWERYWHTIAVSADIIGSGFSRTLTFDNYEPIKEMP